MCLQERIIDHAYRCTELNILSEFKYEDKYDQINKAKDDSATCIKNLENAIKLNKERQKNLRSLEDLEADIFPIIATLNNNLNTYTSLQTNSENNPVMEDIQRTTVKLKEFMDDSILISTKDPQENFGKLMCNHSAYFNVLLGVKSNSDKLDFSNIDKKFKVLRKKIEIVKGKNIDDDEFIDEIKNIRVSARFASFLCDLNRTIDAENQDKSKPYEDLISKFRVSKTFDYQEGLAFLNKIYYVDSRGSLPEQLRRMEVQLSMFKNLNEAATRLNKKRINNDTYDKMMKNSVVLKERWYWWNLEGPYEQTIENNLASLHLTYENSRKLIEPDTDNDVEIYLTASVVPLVNSCMTNLPFAYRQSDKNTSLKDTQPNRSDEYDKSCGELVSCFEKMESNPLQEIKGIPFSHTVQKFFCQTKKIDFEALIKNKFLKGNTENIKPSISEMCDDAEFREAIQAAMKY